MEPDMNSYDLEHVCTAHPLMSKDDWQRAYDDAWARFYSDEHVETIMRRGVASGINPKKLLDVLTVFSGASRIEGVHPLQFGIVRRKIRTQRRHGLPMLNPLLFYPWRVFDFLKVLLRWIKLVRSYRRTLARVLADPTAASYSDDAMRANSGERADHFVEGYADKIPHTHGAPKIAPAGAPSADRILA